MITTPMKPGATDVYVNGTFVQAPTYTGDAIRRESQASGQPLTIGARYDNTSL